METDTRDEICAILLDSGVITDEQLARARRDHERSGVPMHELLIRLGYCGEGQVRVAVAKSLGIPYVDLTDQMPPEEVISRVPADLAYRHQVLPLELHDSTLTVAMGDPLNLAALDDVRLVTGLDVRPALADADAIRRIVEEAYVEQMMEEGQEEDVEVLAEGEEDIADLQRMARESLVIRLVNLILRQAVQDRASDVHIEPFEDVMRVRYRIDGVLHEIPAPAKRLMPAIVSRVKILAELDIAERRMPQDGRIKMLVSGHEIDIRVSVVPTLHGEAVVMRLLDQSSVQLSLTDLGFADNELPRWENIIAQPYGMILACGPTGSGKTTTLYAALKHLYTGEKKIITIEDPVEYQLDGVNQIHVRERIGLSFARGLRHIVRQDPDIIMVGEVRDKETADIAIHAALTGHLILSTLHTNDAPGAVSRLLDMGVEPFLAASSMVGILAQRLVRRICPDCREEHRPRPELIAVMERETEQAVPQVQLHGAGCSSCRYTGYTGRCGMFELLVINDEIRQLILRRASAREIGAVGLREGMTPLRQDGWQKVRDGVTTIEEVVRATAQEDLG
ncbi:MAG: type II secretion system ATPase GspE [Armatimonadota bacterium]